MIEWNTPVVLLPVITTLAILFSMGKMPKRDEDISKITLHDLNLLHAALVFTVVLLCGCVLFMPAYYWSHFH